MSLSPTLLPRVLLVLPTNATPRTVVGGYHLEKGGPASWGATYLGNVVGGQPDFVKSGSGFRSAEGCCRRPTISSQTFGQRNKRNQPL